MAEPPQPTPAPHEDGPSKKKPKRVEKPMPDFLNALDTSTLNDFQLTTEFRMIKNQLGEEELVEVACTISRDNHTAHLDKDLSVHLLRKLVRKIGITRGNLNKTELRYHLLRTKQEIGTINHRLEQVPSTHCRIINVIFHRDHIDDFMTINDARPRAVQETGNGSHFQRFWKTVTDEVNGSECTPIKHKDIPETMKDKEPSPQMLFPAEKDQEDDASDVEVEVAVQQDPYGKLEKREDDEKNEVYNDHVEDAISSGVNPSIKNTYEDHP